MVSGGIDHLAAVALVALCVLALVVGSVRAGWPALDEADARCTTEPPADFGAWLDEDPVAAEAWANGEMA